jgi:hypothetical protein
MTREHDHVIDRERRRRADMQIRCEKGHPLAFVRGDPGSAILMFKDRTLLENDEYGAVPSTGRAQLLTSSSGSLNVLDGDVDLTCVRCWKVCRTTADALRRDVLQRRPTHTAKFVVMS